MSSFWIGSKFDHCTNYSIFILEKKSLEDAIETGLSLSVITMSERDGKHTRSNVKFVE